MRQSESVKNLNSALIKARCEIQNLYPSSKGYGYNYVGLEKIIDMLKDVLPKHGLGYIQLPYTSQNNAAVGLSTRIIHESGEWVEESAEFSLTDMKGVNETQKAGASLTYFRRYALCAAFGITGDEDLDGNIKSPQIYSQKNQSVNKKELIDKTLILENLLNNGTFDIDPRTATKVKQDAQKAIDDKDLIKIQSIINYAENLKKKAS